VALKLQFRADKAERPYRVYGNQIYQGKYINSPKKLGKASLIVNPCTSHQNAVTVPVDIMFKHPTKKEPEFMGQGKACPICWEILALISGNELLKKLFPDL
jgi:hypothetical protein